MRYALTKYSVETKTSCNSLNELPDASKLVGVSRGFCYDRTGNFKAVRVTLYYRDDIYAVNLYEPEDIRDFFQWLDEIFSSSEPPTTQVAGFEESENSIQEVWQSPYSCRRVHIAPTRSPKGFRLLGIHFC